MTGFAGWGARIRTWGCRDQNPVPYRLATPHTVTLEGLFSERVHVCQWEICFVIVNKFDLFNSFFSLQGQAIIFFLLQTRHPWRLGLHPAIQSLKKNMIAPPAPIPGY